MTTPLKVSADPLVLTPRRPKRKIRPSFSPVRTPKVTVSLRPSHSVEDLGPGTKDTKSGPHLPTAALNFGEFTFEANGIVSYSNATAKQQEALDEYLNEHYGGHVAYDRSPFLVVECEEVPAERERPFTIGGMVIVWFQADSDDICADLKIYPGQADEIFLPDELYNMMSDCIQPPEDVILYLASAVFPTCDAISFISDQMIVEFPEVSECKQNDEYGEHLDSLPCRIVGLGFSVMYHNGPLPKTEQAKQMKRSIEPAPKSIEGVQDTTDYVKSHGAFYPGSMIASFDDHTKQSWNATAGVLVARGQQERLVCSHHLWDTQIRSHKSLVGKTSEEAQQAFRLIQGDPGTDVGFLRERVGITDLALVQLRAGINFENFCLDSGITLKKFVRSTDQRPMDQYVMDSFATGQQRLQCAGKRFKFGARLPRGGHSTLRVPKGLEHLWPEDHVAYIALQQGIFATNEPILTRRPYIRAGICGSVLVRSFDAARASRTKSRESEKEVLARGECCGLMHFVDLQSRHGHGLGDYLIFADAFDPLIDDGWQIVQAPELEEQFEGKEAEEAEPSIRKAKLGVDEGQGESSDEDDGKESSSPTKKPKLSHSKELGSGKV